ncbi:cupin domain-containing protein, partial [Bacillus sp. SIMBA_008]
ANCNQNRGTINPTTQLPNQQQNLYYQDSYYFPLYWGY